MNVTELKDKYARAQKRFGTENILFILFLIAQAKFYMSLRSRQLVQNIPCVWNYNTVLYVGATERKMSFLQDFIDHGYEIDILEINKPNIPYLSAIDGVNGVIEGDIRNVKQVTNHKYDIVFWWHGPEHINRGSLDDVLEDLKDITEEVIICGCPWGVYPQGALDNNPWQEHLSSLYPEDFERLGFRTSTLGKKDVPGSNILSWYRIEGDSS